MLHHFHDVIVLDSFLWMACQIRDECSGGRNMESYASELLFQFWDDFAHRLGSANGCKVDVLGSPMFIMPTISLRGHPQSSVWLE